MVYYNTIYEEETVTTALVFHEFFTPEKQYLRI